MTRLVLFALLGLVAKAQAQGDFKNSLQIEGFGNGVYYSINYERIIKKNTLAKIGLMVANAGVVVPVLVGKYFGQASGHSRYSVE